MAPKEPTRAQLSSRLTYTSGQQPAFLRRLQNKIAGTADSEDEFEGEYEDDGSGRPPIPRRPAIPERPEGDEGSEDEDGRDEAPQIVVLREGKHLSGWEVENEKRKAKGLPPLPRPSSPSADADADKPEPSTTEPPPKKEREKKGLNFSTSGAAPNKSKKRKVVPVGGEDELDAAIERKVGKKKKKAKDGDSEEDHLNFTSFGLALCCRLLALGWRIDMLSHCRSVRGPKPPLRYLRAKRTSRTSARL
ncbi:unnamed protein product [Peniophora sp. CBMAI 1063]|nr:unnamed protein product [Peniophora sp. CBMAI 1063]